MGIYLSYSKSYVAGGLYLVENLFDLPQCVAHVCGSVIPVNNPACLMFCLTDGRNRSLFVLYTWCVRMYVCKKYRYFLDNLHSYVR